MGHFGKTVEILSEKYFCFPRFIQHCKQIKKIMHESMDESTIITTMYIHFSWWNAYLWRNINVICRLLTFFHVFLKLLPQSLNFWGWYRFDGITLYRWKSKLHEYMHSLEWKYISLEKFHWHLLRPKKNSCFFYLNYWNLEVKINSRHKVNKL
jgi:hypothetical protein